MTQQQLLKKRNKLRSEVDAVLHGHPLTLCKGVLWLKVMSSHQRDCRLFITTDNAGLEVATLFFLKTIRKSETIRPTEEASLKNGGTFTDILIFKNLKN